MTARGAPALALLLAALPAAAQDQPRIFPTRDVAVSYRFIGEAAAQAGLREASIAWLAAGPVMRMDMPGLGWIVADHAAQRGFMVMEQARVLMEIPLAQAQGQFAPWTQGRLTRLGTDRVAGLACTVWLHRDARGEGRACLTEDGVALRAEGTEQGRSGGLEAISVSYGPQDPARFRRPEGFAAMPVPQAPRQGR